MSSPRCFKINRNDNVATLLDDANTDAVSILGDGAQKQVKPVEPIHSGHKIALVDLAQGQPIVKFGVIIGRASRDIRAGQWVHLHNCASEFDERSQTLDLQTGDLVTIHGTGAYTASYSSVGFNGFPPLRVRCVHGGGDSPAGPEREQVTGRA